MEQYDSKQTLSYDGDLQSTSTTPEPILMISDGYGIYIPRNFYEGFDLESWGLEVSDYGDLSDPDHEHYWDAWLELLDAAKHRDTNGVLWYLYQNGDLWAVPADYQGELFDY